MHRFPSENRAKLNFGALSSAPLPPARGRRVVNPKRSQLHFPSWSPHAFFLSRLPPARSPRRPGAKPASTPAMPSFIGATAGCGAGLLGDGM